MLKSFAIIFLLTGLLIIAAPAALAQDIGLNQSLDIIANQGGFKTGAGIASDSFLDTTVGGAIAIALGLVGSIFLALIIFSGFQWMTAGGNEEKVTKARTKIGRAVMGLSLIVLAYIITNAVFAFFYQATDRKSGVPQSMSGQMADCDSSICSNPDVPCPLCPLNQHCDGGNDKCFCTSSNECPGDLVCNDRVCVAECISNSDCPPNHHCTLAGQCVLNNNQSGDECEDNYDCGIIYQGTRPYCYEFQGARYCVQCISDNNCASPLHCYNPPPGIQNPFCAECGINGHCPPNQQCIAGDCV